MATDIELKLEGMTVLLEQLGIVEAERFVALIQREKFDYTHWRENLWESISVQDLSDAAMKHRNTSSK